jgi:hypothetical protein
LLLPAVRGRSLNTGPNESALRTKTPVVGSNVYVKPGEDEPSGKVEICVAMFRFSSCRTACNVPGRGRTACG